MPIWDQRHLLHALLEFEKFYNEHRPHQGLANARPLHPLPQLITSPEQLAQLDASTDDSLRDAVATVERQCSR
ncbi:hypothetical protein [Saccharopolyspora shandongensis]|uniref:hypothetical protein n=1 Tax=Saccharopolyspora shandongensis TaxID=418495 RepID=UPI0033ED5BFF